MKETASRQGLTANFMARPWAKDGETSLHCGNGAHFNHSVWSEDGATNLFYAGDQPDNVSLLARVGNIARWRQTNITSSRISGAPDKKISNDPPDGI